LSFTVDDWHVSILVVACAVNGLVGTVALENDEPRLKRKLLILPSRNRVVCTVPFPTDGVMPVPLVIVPDMVAEAPCEEPTNTRTTPEESLDTAMYVHVESDTAIDDVAVVDPLVVG
jgi:hypothetical protein